MVQCPSGACPTDRFSFPGFTALVGQTGCPSHRHLSPSGSRMSEIGSQKSEVRSRIPTAFGQKSEEGLGVSKMLIVYSCQFIQQQGNIFFTCGNYSGTEYCGLVVQYALLLFDTRRPELYSSVEGIRARKKLLTCLIVHLKIIPLYCVL